MFKRPATSIFFLSLMIFPFTLPSLSGQEAPVRIGDLKDETMAFYRKGQYDKALRGFTVLSEKAPDDAMYRYYRGVCMVKLNRDTDEAIEHLYYASSRGVPEDAWFYLGMAYHLEYNFSEANKYFKRFERESTRQQARDLNIRHWINTSRSAGEITGYYYPFKLLNVAFISLYDSAQFSQVRMRGGKLVRKPERFYGESENREELNSLMFMPERPDKGDYVYFATYERNRKDGSEIYRSRRTGNRSWSAPEALKSLNTGMDELLPYFDPIENDLYFASNGREGIGGFDLYKSHYDLERDEWSEPMNLGFPINSAVDDYLFLPGSDLGMALVFSARAAKDSMVTVYRAHFMDPKERLSASDTRKLKQVASFGEAAEEALADIESIREPLRPAAKDPTERQQRPSITGQKSPEPDSYQSVLSMALRHQSAADSLSGLATDVRIRVRESEDPNDRWVWQKQIMVWEKKSRDEQEAADEWYRKLRAPAGTVTPQQVPETIRVDTVINDITVFTYINPERNDSEDRQTVGTKQKQERSGKEADNLRDDFKILPVSPYSASTPIPLNVPVPGGVFYTIQLGAFGTEVAPDAFGGLSPVNGEYVQERELFKYYVGRFSRYADASSALQQVRVSGYYDAFIVAYYNGQKTSTTRAQALE
ncbi:MAG: SPOR domain-containing protein [Bacteroidales bacterium]|nr:SPOR domain-containing protein [Bacteroidales bacterium]MBN2698330.1 SPOR domain-containing protein [Bacteroidales bacterium]